ncbi:MAG: hypothetical protein WCO26_25430 [Deltaproteobacteria bacterium]
MTTYQTTVEEKYYRCRIPGNRDDDFQLILKTSNFSDNLMVSLTQIYAGQNGRNY